MVFALGSSLFLFGTMLPAASGAESTTIGAAYNDGLDSRASATAFSVATAQLGYASSSYTSGRLAADAWSDGLSSAVFGVFGHGNAGIMQTAEGPTDETDEILAAGDLGYLSGGNVYFWSDYLPYIDVDDLRLAVFGGCYTGNVDYDLSSFGRVGAQRGVDAIVGFTGLVYYPALCGESCSYSGNYFWQRFSAYTESGETVGGALSRARADLVAKEGDSGGWEQWQIDGSVQDPSQVRLSPAGSGKPLTSAPFGLRPFSLTSLSMSSRENVVVDGQAFQQVRTTEGVDYRLDSTGDLMWLSAPASTTGSATVSPDEAVEAALGFAERHVSWFNGSAGATQVSHRSHGENNDLWAVSWRMAGGGPQVLELEVDRRTGAVVDFVAARRSTQRSSVTISREGAAAAALALTGHGTVVAAIVETWDQTVWRVTVDQAGARSTPDREQLLFDGGDGSLISRTAT